MFRFICKTLVEKQRIRDINFKYVRYLASRSSISKPKPTDQQSLTISFLTDSCGLSLEKAISVSKLVNIQNTENPNTVIQLLTSHGFSKSQVATLISRFPRILLADSELTLKPKIEYFESVGFVGPDLPKVLCSNANILGSSLKNHLMPTFDFLKSFVKTNQNLVHALKTSSSVICCNVEKQMVPNMKILRANGVPEPHIAKLLVLQAKSLILRGDLFENVVRVVKEMGFDPKSNMFLLAVRTLTVMSKAKWENKKDILMSFGWSEQEFNLAFKKNPLAMLSSAKKITKMMNFFVNKVGLKPSEIVRCPNLLLASLDKKIYPRWLVLQVLASKNLLKKDVNVIWILNSKKQDFEKMYIACHMDDPEVMRAYQGALGSHCSVD